MSSAHTLHRAQLREIKLHGGRLGRVPADKIQQYGCGVFWETGRRIQLARSLPWYVTLIATEHELQHLRDHLRPPGQDQAGNSELHGELRAHWATLRRWPLLHLGAFLWMFTSGDTLRTARACWQHALATAKR